MMEREVLLFRIGTRSSRGSQAKGFDRTSVSSSTTAGAYQQAAAKFGPLASAASSTAGSVETPRILSDTALKTMNTIILEPILKDNKFQDFWDICKMAGEQMQSGRIGSLRDFEKFLFHKAVRSILHFLFPYISIIGLLLILEKKKE